MKRRWDMETCLTIKLNSLVQRVGRRHASQLRELANDNGCQLQRIRRSRHWQIKGSAQQLTAFCLQCRRLANQAVQEVIERIVREVAQCEAPPCVDHSAELRRLARDNAALTIAQLMAKTDCTLSEARATRDIADEEWL